MRTLISGGTLLDGTGAAPAEAMAILLSEGRIEAVGREGDFGSLDGDMQTLDASGRWVLPGLVNMHEHLMLRGLVGDPLAAVHKHPVEKTLIALRNSVDALQRGWTTVREMGSTDGIAIAVRGLISRGEQLGPRVIAAGSPICITGGHAFPICVEADGEDDCRRAAREQLQGGADFLKVMASHDPYPMPGDEQTRPEMRLEEVRAVFEEARGWGKRTACHAMGREAIDRVLRAEVDVVDHGHYLDDALAERMAAQGTFLCPTLSSYDRQTMNPKFERGEEWARAHRVLVEPHERAFAAAVRAGVRIVSGTDTVGSYGEELELMRAGGMSPMETLLACTSTAAQALGLEAEIGTVRPGLAADLVLLREDPLADPYGVEQVEWVVKAGVVHRTSDLMPAASARA